MAVDSFKSITMSFEGIGLKAIIDDATVKKYATSLKGLTLEQANLALSTTQLSATEKERVLVEAGLIAQTEALTATDAIYRLQQKLGNDLSAEEILISAGLVTQKEIEDGTTIKLTADKLKQALATEKLSLENYKLIASTFGVEGANYGEAVSFEVLTKAIWSNIAALAKWLVTNPIGWCIIAGAAIAGVAVVVSELTESLEESREKLSELKDECNSIESELSSMNNELKTTVDRINELAKKDKLSFTEKEEYDNLEKTNNELERKIALLELEQKINNQEKNKTFVQTMQKDVAIEDERVFTGKLRPDDTAETIYITEKELIKQKFAELNELQIKLGNATTETQIKTFEEQIRKITDYLLNKNKQWTTDSEGISYILNPSSDDDKAVNEWLDYINDFQDQMAIAMGGTNAKSNAFHRLVDNWKFDGIVQGLQDLGKQGKVTAEMLNDPKYDEFIKKLVEIGVIDSADNLDLIAFAFNNFDSAIFDTSDAVDTTTNSIYNLVEASDNLKDSLDNTFSNQSTIQSAFDKIQEGTSLSADEVRKLIELCPQLSSEFVKTADGYTIGADKLIKANESVVESTKNSLQERADYLKQFINTDYDTSGIGGSYEAKKYNEWQQSVANAKSELEGLELVLSMFGLTTEDTDDKLEELTKSTSNLVSKAKTLSSAFAEQKENGKLSSDTILSLIENGYSAVLMYDKKTGAVRLNTQAYLDLAKAEIQAQIAEVSLAKMNDTAMQDKLNAQREIVSNLGWSYLGTAEAAIKMAEAQEIINNADADLSKYDAQMAALQELEKSLGLVIEGKYGGSGSNSDPWKDEAESKISEIKHLEVMGEISHEEYINRLDAINQKYFANRVKYEDEFNKYEEEIYKDRKNRDQDLFDQKIDNYEKLADKILDDKVEVPEESIKLADFNKKMQDDYGLGNVDLTKRPKVNMPDGSIATVYSDYEFLWQGDEENGKYVAVHYTPILPDGTILDDESLRKYIFGTLEGANDILKADTKGIVLKVDTDIDISESDIKSLEDGKPTENIQNIMKACNDWGIALHEVQAEWLTLSEAAEKAGTTVTNKFDYAREQIVSAISETQNRINELKASGKQDVEDEIKSLEEDIEKFQEKLDKIDKDELDYNVDNYEKLADKALEDNNFEEARTQINSAITDVQNSINFLKESGVSDNNQEIKSLEEDFEKFQEKLDKINKSEISFDVENLDKSLDTLDECAKKVEETSTAFGGAELNTQEKWSTIRDFYSQAVNLIQEEIDKIVQAGVEGNEEVLEKLEKQKEEYQNKISDTFKSAAKEEQDYIEKQKKAYSDLYDERIDKIKEQQEAAEEAAQAEIDAVQEKIDALKKVNEEQQTALDIEKARQELAKASQRTRQVYGADGSISFQVDQEKVKDAKEKLDKLIFEQTLKVLEDQKDALENAKKTQSEAYKAIIKNLETEKENGEKRFDILLQALDKYLNPDKTTSNVDVWSELAKIEGAKYENGVWKDKDGNEIDINELMKSTENKTEDEKKSETDNAKADTEDNGVITGKMERMTFDSENSDIDDEVTDKAGTALENFFRNLEQSLGLKSGSLTLENAYQMYSNSPMMNFDPYGAMKERSGLANKEYVSNVNNNNNASNVTIGDININNPVGDSNDLAKELMMNLPNAFQKQIYTNLK